MECIYLPELSETSTSIVIPMEEAKHIVALRLKPRERLLATNGLGLMALVEPLQKDKMHFTAIVNSFFPNQGENNRNVSLAIGLLDDRARFEFALEKSIELGINEFIPVKSQFCQKVKYKHERILAKAVASMKQCKRSLLPKLYEPLNFSDLINIFPNYDTIILADENGTLPNLQNSASKILVLIGPEGGFSPKEIEEIKLHQVSLWNLGIRRLRAETAAIAALSFISIAD